MVALKFDIRINSLFSIRVPFTWQSALTYPVLPPSAVIGLCANALQRTKNDRHPLEYLAEIEGQTIWAVSKLTSPCVVKSYITSAITKWGDTIGGKFTNALTRQFAFAKSMQCVLILTNEDIARKIANALTTAPLTCGDSESPIILDTSPNIVTVEETNSQEVKTSFPVPFAKGLTIVNGKGLIYLMHERCMAIEGKFPLKNFIVPLTEEKKVLQPTEITVAARSLKVLRLSNDSEDYIVKQVE